VVCKISVTSTSIHPSSAALESAANVQFAQNESLDAVARADAVGALRRSKLPAFVCKTASGAAWLKTYLHPPSGKGEGFSGIPDRNAGCAVDYSWRLSDELDMGSVTAVLPTATRAVIVTPPSVFRQRFVFATDGTALAQVCSLNIANRNITATSWNVNAEAWRMAALSDTFEQDATAFNNAGMLYGAQWVPGVSTFAFSSIEFVSRFGKHIGHDRILDGIQKQRIASACAEERLMDTTPALHIQVVSLGAIPLNGGDVLMKSPKSARWRSTVGGWFRHRFTEPTQRYLSQARNYTSTTGAGSAVGGSAVRYLCLYEFYDPTTDTWQIQNLFSAENPSATVDVAEWYPMTWGILLYDFSAAVAGGFNVAPLVHNRDYTLEAVPPFGSMNTALIRRPPMLDQEALDHASSVGVAEDDMLPAAANAGGFISAIARFAPTVLSTLGGILSGVFKGKGEQLEAGKAIGGQLSTVMGEVRKLAAEVKAAKAQAMKPAAKK